MIPNNILYRRILQALDTETEYAKFYSSLYYMKRIAMQYGASYTGCNCSNKYLKDWAELVGVELDGEHHTNNWYLRRIALKISGQSELEHNTDNYCLTLILENITPPTPQPTATQLKVYINDEEIDTSQTPPTTILSYSDSESADFKFIALDGNNDPVKNYAITVTQGSNTYNLKTNSNGIATYSYESQGIGDTSVVISSTLVSKTFVIIDGKWYNNGASTNGLSSQSGVSTTSDGEYITITTSTSGEKYVLTPISVASNDNWEFSCKCKTSSYNAQALGWHLANENSFSLFDNRFFACGTSGIYSRLCGSAQSLSVDISDNDVIRVQRVDGYWKLYVNDTLVQTCSHSWSGNKTISFYTNQNRVQHLKEILIKPL